MALYCDIKKDVGNFSLDISFESGDVCTGFLGASGCGKSLTLRCIAGIEKPDSGRIVVNDKVFFDSEMNINLTPQQRKTALLFQNYMLFPNLTVEKNIAAGIEKGLSAKEKQEIVSNEVKRFSLSGLENRYPAQLSGGQQQRVALARMLAANPDILMLDEPFSALDSHLKGVLEQNLSNLFDTFRGTILYVSHDIDEALRFCETINVVDSGHIVEASKGRELVNSPKSKAGLALSGCKNITPVEKVSDRSLLCSDWGITLEFDEQLPEDVGYFGIRATFIERASGPGKNNFRVKVTRCSDSRFERVCLLRFLDNDKDFEVEHFQIDEMKFLSQHLIWRIYDGGEMSKDLPNKSDELWIHIPTRSANLVSK